MTPTVVGRYEIVRLLGRGGMASVHLARQPALDREVALKELRPVHAADDAFARRFLHESRVGAALNHPSVVSVIEYLEHDGAPYIAMEYLERGSLRPLVGRLSLAQVAGVMESVLAGLTEAAAHDIVHRDLKPENVLITADGHAKVADFGIAKALGEVCMTDFRTATGQIVGTPAYMAPEQVSGGEITPQVDLYATGLIAYELLAGQHPFHGTEAPVALLVRQVNDEPPPLAEVRPDLPPGVVAWVHAMLAKEPGARPAGAAHAWDRLEGVVADELGPRWRRAAAIGQPEPPAEEPAEEPEAPPSQSGVFPVVLPDAEEPEPTWPSHEVLAVVPEEAPTERIAATPRRPLRRRALAAILATTLLVAVAGFMFTTAPGEEPQAAPPPPKPSLTERVRDVVAPALRADARVSNALSSLSAGDDPERALARVDAAMPTTESAFAAARDLAPARQALRTQRQYLEVVRDTLRVEADGARLGALSARLVARLEAIEPGAGASVHGAHRLRLWAIAELAAQQPPPIAPTTVTAPAPTTPPPSPAAAAPAPAAATPTPTPTATAPVAATPAPALHPRRALRQRLRRLVQRAQQ